MSINETNVEINQGGLPASTPLKISAPTQRGALASVTAPTGMLMDSKSTSGILANMEKLANEINNPWRKMQSGLKDMTAWTSYNKGPAFALREAEEATDRNTLYNIRQQQAAMEAAQLQAQAEAQQIDKFKKGIINGGGAGAGGPNMAQQQLLSALNTVRPGDIGAQRALIDKFNKEQITGSSKAQYDPSAIKQENFFFPGVGDVTMSTNDFNALPQKTRDVIEKARIARLNSAGLPVETSVVEPAKKAVVMPETDVPAEGLSTPFYAQESSSGKADTSKPGIQGAQGPMQVTKDTFDNYKKKGIIPSSYDLNDPGQAYASGVLILNDLHKKHGQDINKIAAEYFGGPGAINLDGSINVTNKDANGKTVGSYINDIRGRMKLPPIDIDTTAEAMPTGAAKAPAQSAVKVPPPVGMPDSAVAVSSQIPQFNEPKPNRGSFGSSKEADSAIAAWEKRRDAALDIYKNYEEKAGAASVEAFKEAEKNFVTLTDDKKLGARQTILNSLNGWVNRYGGNDRVVGLLSKPDLGNAIADAIRAGIETPVGRFGLAEVERLVQAGMPGLTSDEVQALKQLNSIMGPRILQIVEQTKGASSDKDWAAYQSIAGNASSGYDFLKKAVEYDKASLKADKEDRALYNRAGQRAQRTDYRSFAANPERSKIYEEYNKETDRIANTKFEFKKLPPKPAGMPTNVPSQWSESTQSYWIGDKQYKVK